MSLLDIFLDCVSYDTKSGDNPDVVPSSEKQRSFAYHLQDVMKEIGISDVFVDEHAYVYGRIPATVEGRKTIGFIAHMDTSPEISGENVKPRLVENYHGGDIVLNQELNIITKVKDFPNIARHKGKTLIVTDGTTLLGCDDKGGIAIILQAAKEIIESDIPHGEIKIAFTPDEEIGNGPAFFDVKGFAADYAYTVDGGSLGELEYENFNAASAKVTVKGRSVHPGGAKNKMINSMTVAMEFASMLPKNEAPEHTEGYEGFSHLVSINGDIETTVMDYIIRDHDLDLLNKKIDRFNKIAEYLNDKYEIKPITVEIKNSYYNMKEKILPNMFIIDQAKEAMLKNGVEPLIIPIRGGTDGAQLSFMGLPCPNICTAGENAHGRYEFAVLDDMIKIKDIVKTIIYDAK